MKDNILLISIVTIHTIAFFIYTTLIVGVFESTLTMFIATYITMFIVSMVALPITAIEISILGFLVNFFVKKQEVL